MLNNKIQQIKRDVVHKRCHTCKVTKDLKQFYITKDGRINTFKCKECYKKDFLEVIREAPL